MKKGFTLIELLVAVVIIGVLATIGTVQYIKSAEKSKLSEALMVMNSVAKTEQHHYFAKDKYTKKFADLSLDFMDKTGTMVQNDKMDTNNYKMTLESNRVRSERTTGDYTLFEYYRDEKITCAPKEHFICQNYPEETNTSGDSTEEPESEPQRSLEPYCSYYENGSCNGIRKYNEDGGYTVKSGCASIVDNICVNPMQETTYDANGNLLSTTYCDGPDDCYGGGKYEYDANGNMTSHSYCYDEGSCYPDEKWEYDENGNMTSHSNCNGLGSCYVFEKYEYDANGNETSHSYCDESDSCSVDSKWEYEYDGNGNKTSQKYYDSSGELGNEYKYTYDENGNMTSSSYCYDSDNCSEVDKWEYDANGNMTSSVNHITDDMYEYEYDANGNKTSDKKYYGSTLYSITEYSKDENGNPVEKYCDVYSGGMDAVNEKCL